VVSRALRLAIAEAQGVSPVSLRLAVGLLLAVFAVDSDAQTAAPPAPTRVVRSGTAFFVTSSGLALTSAHVVDACRVITVWPADASPRRARLLRIDRKLDIALLAVNGAAAEPLPLSHESSPTIGAAVTILGFGRFKHEPRVGLVSSGHVAGEVKLRPGLPVITINANLGMGNSGSPVLNEKGDVTGIIIGLFTKQPHISVAIPARKLIQFIGRESNVPVAVRGFMANTLLRTSAVLVQCIPGNPPMPPRTHR